MKLLKAFFKLVRWPNLLFVIITQVLFHYAVVVPSAYGEYYNFPLYIHARFFWLLCVSSVLIAAAGYIINDYFDVNIDQINKPNRNMIDKVINRRWALAWHMLLSVSGIGIGLYLGWAIRNPIIPVAHVICVVLLWFYSTSFKRQMLVGNIVISGLTAWVILVQLVAELPGWWTGSIDNNIEKLTVTRLSRIGMLYAGFAFVISLVREVIKDVEDLEGDRRNGCETLPIVMGVNAAKMFVSVWLIILIAALIITQAYVLMFGWWWSALYVIILVIAPLFVLFKKLMKANVNSDYSYMSALVKFIMFTGILSMAFFIYYTK